MKIDILDYLGKINGGVLVLISLLYEDEYYEGSFFYTEDMLAITPDEKLEEKLESKIEDWEGYEALMLELLKKVVPYKEMYSRVDDFDPNKYINTISSTQSK